MPPKRSKRAKKIKIEHDCAFQNGRSKCTGCELGIVNGKMANIDDLHAKIERASEIYENNKSDFAERLHNRVQMAKDDIELTIDSLKSELDKLRDDYFKDLDDSEQEILNFIEINNAKRAKLEDNNDTLQSLKDTLKNNLKRNQDLLNFSYQISTSENLTLQWKFDKNTAIRINYESNHLVPNSKWKYISEKPNFQRLQKEPFCLSISYMYNAKYLREDLIAIMSNASKIYIYDIARNVQIAELQDTFLARLTYLPSKWLISADICSRSFKIWNLETFESELMQSEFSVDCIAVLDHNLFAFAENNYIDDDEDEDDMDDNKITFWSFKADKLTKVSEVVNVNSCVMEGIVALANKKLAVSSDDILKVLDYESKEFVLEHDATSNISEMVYLRDNLMVFLVDDAANVLNFDTGEIVHSIASQSNYIRLMVFKDALMIFNKGNLEVYDSQTFQQKCNHVITEQIQAHHAGVIQYLGKNRFLVKYENDEIFAIDFN